MIDVYATGLSIDIGRQGENLARNIYFDLSELINAYGEGTATLVHMRPLDKAPYVCAVTRIDTFLVWAPTSTDTSYAGAGKCELRWVVGDVLAKSIVYRTFVTESITGDSIVPSEYESWYEALLEHISEYEIASDQIAANTSDIAVLDGRMDEFTKLPDGSTTGDAELADIRVGADGTQYETAGDAVRTQINDLKEDLSHIGLSDDVKTSLLACFSHVAWIDAHGQDYYDALEAALYAGGYPKITAQFNPGLNVIYTDDSIDTLKQYLTVYYYESKDSEAVIIPSSDYTLLGQLVEGVSSVLISYRKASSTVEIPNVVDFYNIWTWSLGDGRVQKVTGSVDINQSDTTKYPSKATIRTDILMRRNINTTRGILPFYLYNQNAVSSGYYPIPVPKNANHMKITLAPNTQYIFAQVFAYNASNNTYNNSYSQNRITWANGLGGGEIDISRPNGETSMFLTINTKYDSAGTSYPSEPTDITIEFSEA